MWCALFRKRIAYYAHAKMLIVGGRVLNRAFYVCYWRSHIEGAHEKSGAALAAPAATVPSPMHYKDNVRVGVYSTI